MENIKKFFIFISADFNFYISTLKALVNTAADDILKYYFSKNIRFDISCDYLADNSHEMSSLTFTEKQKTRNIILSAAIWNGVVWSMW